MTQSKLNTQSASEDIPKGVLIGSMNGIWISMVLQLDSHSDGIVKYRTQDHV